MPDLSGRLWRAHRALWVAALLAAPGAADPLTDSEVRDVSVVHEDGVFHVYVDTVVAAPLETIEALLMDFEGAGRLNPSIERSEVLGEAKGGIRVRMLVRVCEFFICRNITRTEIVTREAPGVLRGVIEPQGSDFKSGTTEWWLAGQAGGTRLIYSGAFEPDFWVPPLIGSALIARRLREELSVLISNLEMLAQGRAVERGCGEADGRC